MERGNQQSAANNRQASLAVLDPGFTNPKEQWVRQTRQLIEERAIDTGVYPVDTVARLLYDQFFFLTSYQPEVTKVLERVKENIRK